MGQVGANGMGILTGTSDYLKRVDVTDTANHEARANTSRLVSIDLLRGLVIVIMGLDHIRDFFGPTDFDPTDPALTFPALFFTRWITHYCAPIFMFLTGIAAFLYGTGRGSRQQLCRFLLTRGVWLILIEIVVVNTGWQSYWFGLMFVQVIWALGWSMIILAGLIFLPGRWILAIGLVTVFGHNLLDPITTAAFGKYAWIWGLLHERSWIAFGPNFGMMVLYPMIPWFGVMALGYVLGPVFLDTPQRRHKILLLLGASACLLFLLLRLPNLYGEPAAWAIQERGAVYSVLSFLRTTKYPPSLHFLLMTLGPALLVLAYLERATGKLSDILVTFGRVPFFFYVVHIPLVSLLSCLWNLVIYGRFTHYVFRPHPEGYELNLWLVYAAWVMLTVLMYFFCRWFAEKKRKHRTWWMSYL